MRERLVAIANVEIRLRAAAGQQHGNEATLGTLVPRERRLLIVSNGFYGGAEADRRSHHLPFKRSTCRGRAHERRQLIGRSQPTVPSTMSRSAVDTGTGLLDRLEPLAEVPRRRGVALIVDAIASFGGLPIDAEALDLEAIVASPNKWLEGVPGIGLVLIKRAALEKAAAQAHSFCLDLHRQWQSFEHDGRWRFTPPAQATADLVAALRQHAQESGQASGAVRHNWRCSGRPARARLRDLSADEARRRIRHFATGRPEL
jgi:2-aminoethylphosphonate-pyruvate transaminase